MEWSNSNGLNVELSSSNADVYNMKIYNSNALNVDLSNSSAHVVNMELSNSNPFIFNQELYSSHHPLLTH